MSDVAEPRDAMWSSQGSRGSGRSNSDWNVSQIHKVLVQSRGNEKRERQTEETCGSLESKRTRIYVWPRAKFSSCELLKGFKAAIVVHGRHYSKTVWWLSLSQGWTVTPVSAPWETCVHFPPERMVLGMEIICPVRVLSTADVVATVLLNMCTVKLL